MKRRTYKSEIREAATNATRARIIKAAEEVLGNPSLEFSMETVAKRAGVTRLTVYNQFKTKTGLLDATFDHMALRGGLGRLAAIFSHTDPLEATRMLVSVFCEFWISHRTSMPRFKRAISDPEIAANILRRSERRRAGLKVLVGRLLGGRASSRKVRDLADVLFALTSFEFFDLIAIAGRNNREVEEIIWSQAEAAIGASRKSD